MTDLTKLTTEKLMARFDKTVAEIRRRLKRLEKYEAAMRALAPMIGWQGCKGIDTLVCEYCNGTDEDNSEEIVRHMATCPVLSFHSALAETPEEAEKTDGRVQ